MSAATPLPTLSQVQTMDTAYLPEAADYWTRTANLLDEVFTNIHERISTPGGVPWKGQAAKQEWERSYTDMMKVRPVVSQLHHRDQSRRCDREVQVHAHGQVGRQPPRTGESNRQVVCEHGPSAHSHAGVRQRR